MILWCPEGGLFAAAGQGRRPAPAAPSTITPPVLDVPPVPVLVAAAS